MKQIKKGHEQANSTIYKMYKLQQQQLHKDIHSTQDNSEKDGKN